MTFISQKVMEATSIEVSYFCGVLFSVLRSCVFCILNEELFGISVKRLPVQILMWLVILMCFSLLPVKWGKKRSNSCFEKMPVLMH